MFMKVIDGKEYLSVAEAAEYFDVAPSTIRRWVKHEDLVAYQFNPPKLTNTKQVFLRSTDLRRFFGPVAKLRDKSAYPGPVNR
jgi:transposase-like protein